MRDNGSLRFGGRKIEYEVRRSRRRKKTVQFTVGRDGVRVAVPAPTTDAQVRQLVRKRAAWIVKQLENVESQPTPESFRLVTGDRLPYMGVELRLEVEEGESAIPVPQVHLDGRRLRIESPAFLTELDASGEARLTLTRSALISWYFERAYEHIPKLVDQWWPRLGRGDRSDSKVLIRDQRSRWGSCSADGTLRISWRTMMLEPMLIEYVVVHELAHLSVMNHSSDFWDVVEGAIPDVSIRRKRIREAGRALPPL